MKRSSPALVEPMPDTQLSAAKTLSVIVPNYNDGEHLGVQLRAICSQSFRPLEVIVIDDGSTDNSVEIVEQIAIQFPFVKLVKNGTNHGVVYSINKGCRLSVGDYIYSASANDLVLPGLFEKSMKMLERYPQAGLCCSDARQVDVTDGGKVWDVRAGWSAEAIYFSPSSLAEMTRHLKHIRHPMTNTCIIKRDAIPDQMYEPGLICYGDWFLHQVIVSRHGCCYIPEPLAAARWTGSSFSHRVNTDPVLYKQVFSEVVKRFASPQYADVAKLAIRGRVLMDFTPHPRTPAAVLAALKQVHPTSNQAMPLFWHVTEEYLFSLLARAKQAITKRVMSKIRQGGKFVSALAICLVCVAILIFSSEFNSLWSLGLPMNGDATWYRDLGGRSYPEIQDPDLFYQNIGPSVARVKLADAVILGPSFSLFAFEPAVLERFGAHTGQKFYNMSFIGIRSGEFSKRVIQRWHIQPKLWIINVDDQIVHFFSTSTDMWLPGRKTEIETLGYDRLRGFARVLKRNIHWFVEDQIAAWKDGKTRDRALYRSAETGFMNLDPVTHYSTDDKENKKLVVADKFPRHATPETIAVARKFLQDIGSKVVFILVPHSQYCPVQARELGRALGVEVIIPGTDGYTTVDGGGHLDKKSALKFTEFVCSELPKTKAFQEIAGGSSRQ